MRLMRNFGFAGMDRVIYPGTNGKMIEIAAAMGLVNLERVQRVIDTNKYNHNAYRDAVSDIPFLSVMPYDNQEHNNYQYVVMELSPEAPIRRDDLVRALHAENILVRKYFWPGCHKMKPFVDLYPHAGLLLPNTEKVAERVVVFPTGTTIQRADIDAIAGLLRLLFEGS